MKDVQITASGGGVQLTVKVVPGASRTKVAGGWNQALRVAVSAPPEDGRANAELVEFLATVFGVKRAAVSIVRGNTQRVKLVQVRGVDVATAQQKLAGFS
ncbi:MAG: YggU family protein [Planctomycetes bacterium]|nr:YggU family protein [Planctomycetota bacterium]